MLIVFQDPVSVTTVCDVSWPLKALKALCHCASRKLACNTIITRSIVWVEGWAAAPVWVCMHCTCMNMCLCTVGVCVVLKAHVFDQIYIHAYLCVCFFPCLVCVCVKKCFCCGVGVNMSVCISICLSECVFPGLKCQLSTVILCGFCSVRLRGKQTVLIYHRSTDGDTSQSPK